MASDDLKPPFPDRSQPGSTEGADRRRQAGPASGVDVNEAGRDELDAIDGLQGHGHEIVRYRKERGGFTDLRQLEEVPGLTGKVTDAIRARLSIRE